MRQIDPKLQAKLDTGATSFCRCWLVQRADGVSIGFTDHDVDLTFDGRVFQAGTGLDAAALESSTGLSVDNTQAVGALSAVGLTEEDIRAGKYDGAAVWLWLVDWTDVSLKVLLFRGFLGEIQRGDTAFEVELRGLSEVLNKTVGRSYIRECDRLLGDQKCGVDLSAPGLSVVAQVASVRDNRAIWANGISEFAKGWFAFGSLHWLSGDNKGAIGKVKFDTVNGLDRIVEIWEEAPNTIAVGDQFKLTAGCDKAADTCRVKFNNFRNFRGFPQMPGEDWVSAYPNQNGVHDGGSLRNG